MADYHFNEGAFSLPDHAIDRTRHAIEIPAGDKRISVVVSRDRHEGKPLREIFRESSQALAVSLRRYQPDPPQSIDHLGVEGISYSFKFLHEAGLMFNALALLRLETTFLTVHVACEWALASQGFEVMERILASWRFRSSA